MESLLLEEGKVEEGGDGGEKEDAAFNNHDNDAAYDSSSKRDATMSSAGNIQRKKDKGIGRVKQFK